MSVCVWWDAQLHIPVSDVLLGVVKVRSHLSVCVWWDAQLHIPVSDVLLGVVEVRSLDERLADGWIGPVTADDQVSSPGNRLPRAGAAQRTRVSCCWGWTEITSKRLLGLHTEHARVSCCWGYAQITSQLLLGLHTEHVSAAAGAAHRTRVSCCSDIL